MKSAERSLKVMERGIPLIHGKLRGTIEDNLLTTNVNYAYTKKGIVLEICTDDKFDLGKNYHYHTFIVVTPLPLLSKSVCEIVDYHAPEGLSFEARENLEDAVRLWNDKYGFSHVAVR
ncbi:hypothetical protein KY331_03410 [Candidatus Woesearchaeota archaeon]|nr:hypothetical protein [Candidatus Woesearchaeota archaeon]